MTCFSWLHLTDLHRGMKEQRGLWPGVKEEFFKDLERLHDQCGPWDLVLFTGDLTQQGKAEEFQQVDELLEQLWKFFDELGSSPQLLAVPGNHDLVRTSRMTPELRLLRRWSDEPDVQEEFWADAKSPFRQTVEAAFVNYTEWWKNQRLKPKGLNFGILPGDFSVTIEKEGAKLGIVGLNTSFLQLTGDDYEGKLALDALQFHGACSNDGPAWAKQHCACLLLTHHPPAWLDTDSQQHLAGEITDHERFAAHLCGHMHDVAYWELAEGGTAVRRTWQGRSLFGVEFFLNRKRERAQRLHGYTAGRIQLDGQEGEILFWPREARLQGGQRSIVPDFSIHLIDNQHTDPCSFKLLQPPLLVPTRQSLIKVVDDHTFLISNHQGKTYELQLSILPVLSSRSGETAWRDARHWKKVHTLAENLYSEYSNFYDNILQCETAINIKNINRAETFRSSAQKSLNQLKDRIESHYKKLLEILPDAVTRTHPIEDLRGIFMCFDAIMQSLELPLVSPDFQNGITITKAIRSRLLHLLHLADIILEDYFSNEQKEQNTSSQWEEQHLHQKIGQLRKQLELLLQKIDSLSTDVILETRSEEKLRLEHMITEFKNKYDQIQKDLKVLENQFSQLRKSRIARSNLNGNHVQRI